MSAPLASLRPGMHARPKRNIVPPPGRQWKYGAEWQRVGGSLTTSAKLTIDTVNAAPPWLRLRLDSVSPPAFLKISGEEWANNFELAGPANASAAAVGSPSIGVTFARLATRQRVAREGFEALEKLRGELKSNIADARMWGNIAVFANAILLPLNVILNAFKVKDAVDLYRQVLQVIAKELYARNAKSGTRIKNDLVKTLLANIKKAVIEEMKRKGATAQIPGVNIIIGLAEDGWALFETASTVSEGSSEMRQMLRNFDAKVDKARGEYMKIGVEMARLLEEKEERGRTS